MRVLDTTFRASMCSLRGACAGRNWPAAQTGRNRGRAQGTACRRGHSEGPRSPEVFIANQSAVAITVYRLLTEARSGDAIFFLCDSQAVVDWLITALEVQGEG